MRRKKLDAEFLKGEYEDEKKRPSQEKVWVDENVNSFNVYVYDQPELVSALLAQYDKVSPIAVHADTHNSALGKETVVTIRMDVIKGVQSPRSHAFHILGHAAQEEMKAKWEAAKVEMLGEITSVVEGFGFTKKDKKERSAGHGV